MTDRITALRAFLRHRLPWWIYVSFPLIALLLDFAFAPVLVETTGIRMRVVATELLEKERAFIGKLRTHNVAVSVGNAVSPTYLHFLGEAKPVGLTVSVFEDGRSVRIGPLTKSVLDKVKAVAPAEGARLERRLEGMRDYEPGDVVAFPLAFDAAARRRFPVDHLFLVVMNRNLQPDPAERLFAKALPRLFDAASAANVEALVVPAIGHNYRMSSTFSFGLFYRSIFRALEPKGRAMTVYLDLYKSWPTPVLEEAVGELNASIHQTFGDRARTDVYRWRPRLILLLLALCLFFAKGWSIRLTWKSFAGISAIYLGLVFGAQRLIDFAGAEFEPRTRAIWEIAIYVLLAPALLWIKSLNLQAIFRREARP